MEVMIMGYKPVSYTKKDTGEFKEGMSVYYAGKNRDAVGMVTDNLWIDKMRGATLYNKVLAMGDFEQPIPAELQYETEIGARYPALVGINIVA